MSHESLNDYAANWLDVQADRRTQKKTLSRLSRLLLNTLVCWYQRHRQRTALAELDDRLLKDIGLSHSDAAREVRKFFWQR